MTERLAVAGVDPLWVWIALAATAVLLAQAAVAKLADRALFEQHLAAYGVPQALLPLLAAAVPLGEAALALALFTPWRVAAAAAAAGLLLSYGAVMAWHRAHGHRLDCGCGGEPLAVSWLLVLRNALLAALAGLAGAPLGARAMGVGDFGVVAAAVLLGTLLYAALHQILRLAHRTELGRA